MEKGQFEFNKGNIPWNKGKKGLYSSVGKIKNITGQVFGRLTVISKNTKMKNGDHHVYWDCLCLCGKKHVASGTNLRRGHIKSCGCLQIEITKEIRKKEVLENYGQGSKSRAYGAYKTYCKKKGREFSITKEQFLSLSQKNCTYCGSLPSNNTKAYNGVYENGSFTYNGLDRVDSTKGYFLENVVTCCKRCNSAKNNMHIDEFKNWIKKVYLNLYGGNT